MGDSTAHVSRRLAIGDQPLIVLDGLFRPREIGSLYDFLRALPYRLDDHDSDETAYSKHWKAELPVDMAMATPVFKRCIEAARETIAAELVLHRVHVNLHLYGDMQFPHEDLAGGATALYYANPEWRESWLGETVFYDGHREPLHTVAPRPGRLLLFHGSILHRAGVPSRECYEPRISVAFKFQPRP